MKKLKETCLSDCILTNEDVTDYVLSTSSNVVTSKGVYSELSNYVHRSTEDIEGKVGSEVLDYLKLRDQNEEGEGHGLIRKMCISASTWQYLDNSLPDNCEVLQATQGISTENIQYR